MIVVMQKDSAESTVTLEEKLCKMKHKLLELEEKLDEHIAADKDKKANKEEEM